MLTPLEELADGGDDSSVSSFSSEDEDEPARRKREDAKSRAVFEQATVGTQARDMARQGMALVSRLGKQVRAQTA